MYELAKLPITTPVTAPLNFVAMTSMTFGQKKFIPTAPEKGSFPLDHEGQCKKLMLYYMRCLRTNNDDNSACRQECRAYLQCRMDHNLMAKEEFSKLGFSEEGEGKKN
ncbi:hypothetical protein quinque_006523 [Culex quinquefasciatus]